MASRPCGYPLRFADWSEHPPMASRPCGYPLRFADWSGHPPMASRPCGYPLRFVDYGAPVSSGQNPYALPTNDDRSGPQIWRPLEVRARRHALASAAALLASRGSLSLQLACHPEQEPRGGTALWCRWYRDGYTRARAMHETNETRKRDKERSASSDRVDKSPALDLGSNKPDSCRAP